MCTYVCVRAGGQVLTKLQADLEHITATGSETNHSISTAASHRVRARQDAFAETAAGMRVELDILAAEHAKARKANAETEEKLRARKFKAESEVTTWISQYDAVSIHAPSVTAILFSARPRAMSV